MIIKQYFLNIEIRNIKIIPFTKRFNWNSFNCGIANNYIDNVFITFSSIIFTD